MFTGNLVKRNIIPDQMKHGQQARGPRDNISCSVLNFRGKLYVNNETIQEEQRE